jgi:hypothetical protein
MICWLPCPPLAVDLDAVKKSHGRKATELITFTTTGKENHTDQEGATEVTRQEPDGLWPACHGEGVDHGGSQGNKTLAAAVGLGAKA